MEKKAVKSTSINIFASNWAKLSAISFYKLNSDDTKVLPFGANIPNSKIKQKVFANKNDTINITFSGVDWKRKGGDIAVGAVKKLVKDGYNVKLTICGIKKNDLEISKYDFIENLGFLNKNNSEDLEKYLKMWENTDILLLPTRAECAGIVFNEASAYGVPTITTNTGGVADYVKNNINGYRLSLDAKADDYAVLIENLIDNNRLTSLSKGAIDLYNKTNSWKAWGKSFNKITSGVAQKNNKF